MMRLLYAHNNNFFKLASPDINDLGSCSPSTICATFYYSTSNGFSNLQGAE